MDCLLFDNMFCDNDGFDGDCEGTPALLSLLFGNFVLGIARLTSTTLI
tara:strand:+ start:853 stop:996 length:144 start_codon:yes stop_codon:yes gene_type:complete